MSDRREFLRAAGALALGNIALGLSGCARNARAATSASRPHSRLDRIGLQLYTVRGPLAKDFDGTLARVAQVGYKEVEFAGYQGRTAQQVRKSLDTVGLSAPAAHIALAEVQASLGRILNDAAVIGHQWIVVPWIDASMRRSLDGWRAIADALNTAGAAATRAGVGIAYHNHDFEFRPIEGRLPYDVLLERTDPALVKMELDLYWMIKGGQDPLAYFTRWPGRFAMLHVKDSSGPPAHSMRDVGAGTIDFAKLFARQQQAGVSHWFVEHDEPADPFASISASYAHLRALEF
jgi:sugar phosphate isomerase/epimerase